MLSDGPIRADQRVAGSAGNLHAQPLIGREISCKVKL
jgi:hypothetical protein